MWIIIFIIFHYRKAAFRFVFDAFLLPKKEKSFCAQATIGNFRQSTITVSNIKARFLL
jgi:hypothetical protein